MTRGRRHFRVDPDFRVDPHFRVDPRQTVTG